MLLAVVGFNMFAGIAKGRDTRRLQDVNDLNKALQLILIADKKYPVYPTEVEINGTDPINTRLLTDGATTSAIKDPINDGTLKYWYQSNANGTTYQIRFCQETDQVQGTNKDCTNIKTP